MDDNTLKDMLSVIAERFGEMDSAIVTALPEKDECYAALALRKKELLRFFPRMESWISGGGPLSLTEEEHAGLTEYLSVVSNMEDVERRAIYFAGHHDCFAYLKRIGLL
jgi:hypothetical protein